MEIAGNEPPPKCAKIEENGASKDTNGSKDDVGVFENFTITKVLNENARSKMICLLGRFENNHMVMVPEAGEPDNEMDNDKQAVVILEKTPIPEDVASKILSKESGTTLDLKNDVYHLYQTFPPKELNGIYILHKGCSI